MISWSICLFRGDIISYKLLEHKDKDTDSAIQMADSITSSNRAFALSFGGKDNSIINDTFSVKKVGENTIIFTKDFENKDVLGNVHKFTLLKRYEFMPGEYAVAVVDKMIFFRFGTYKFGSVLLEGQFPNYARVIPENQAHSFQVQKSDLTDALKRVALMVDKKAGRLYFNISDGVLKITSQQSDMGSADEEIPCEYAGQA